jgi:hypothetical protein
MNTPKLLQAAIVFGIALTAALPAGARSTTGFASFHVWGNSASNNAYTCLNESNGAVVNNCGYVVTLVFDLPVDNTGTHNLTVQSYSGSDASFTCNAWGYDGSGNGWEGASGTFFSGDPSSGYTIYPNVTINNNGESIQLICWGIPQGAGIANINWSA